jgi:hypothetical protein
MQAIEFGTAVRDGTIEIPQEYRKDFSSFVRVILIKEEERFARENDENSALSERLAAFDRLDGLLAGRDLDVQNARNERLSRQ